MSTETPASFILLCRDTAFRLATTQSIYRPFGAFRLFLASLVVLQHYLALAPHWLARKIEPFELGSLAVYVFFVASGYIISEAAHRFYSSRPIAFLANRFVRILPLAVVAIAANVGIWAARKPSGSPRRVS
jgi:peptidoglycan/LPS O-acetylase OafA/YrhL